MRLPKEQVEFLKKEIQKYDQEAQVFLFGSRADDSKKGGDIDILILSKDKFSLENKISVKVKFQKKFGEQKLDLVSFTHNQESNFKNLILDEAIEI